MTDNIDPYFTHMDKKPKTNTKKQKKKEKNIQQQNKTNYYKNPQQGRVDIHE